MSDLDQTLTTAQAAMVFVASQDWDRYAAWCLANFGRIPVNRTGMGQAALEIGKLIDPERLPE